MNRFAICALLATAAGAFIGQSARGAIFSETFSTDGPFPSASYPEWTYVSSPGAVTSTATGGVLNATGISGTNVRSSVVIPALTDVTISATVSSSGFSFGQANVGLRWGDLDFLFHPGYPGGAFRIDVDNGAANIVGNTNMGFTPAGGQAYDISVHGRVIGLNTKFDVVITNGINTFAPSTFTIPNVQVEDFTLVGLYMANDGTRTFDNFRVVPEPSTLALGLLGLASLGFVAQRRCRRE